MGNYLVLKISIHISNVNKQTECKNVPTPSTNLLGKEKQSKFLMTTLD